MAAAVQLTANPASSASTTAITAARVGHPVALGTDRLVARVQLQAKVGHARDSRLLRIRTRAAETQR